MSTGDQEARARTMTVVQAYQTLLSEQKWEEWAKLWADDGVLEFPFAPAGYTNRYEGRDAIVAYMSSTPGKIRVDSLAEAQFHPQLDPQKAIIELKINGHAVTTDKPYNQRYVVIFELEKGLIASYREYWNPLITMDAFGGYDAWIETFYTAKAGAAA